MRVAKVLCCAVALFALLAPGVRADDWNKLTYFTFSGPVQVPGVMLPAGTYMFKLADPESGRRAIQIWDKDGKKLYTTLLSITNERMDIPKEPMVMFTEQPSGEAPAVRTWFYEGVRAGYEFVYPKDQAMKIAQATHSSVLAMNTESSSDLGALRGAKVGRIDEKGQFIEESASASASDQSVSSTNTQSVTSTSDRSSTIDASTPASVTTSSGSTVSAASGSSASVTATSAASSDTSTSASATSTTAPAVSANRTASLTASPQPVIASPTTEERRAEAAGVVEPTPVGTAGQSAPRQLPRTASSLPLLELLTVIMLVAAVSVRQLRKRFSENV